MRIFHPASPIIKSIVNLRNPTRKDVCRSRSSAIGKILGGGLEEFGLGLGTGIGLGIAWSGIEETMSIFYW